MTKPAKPAYGSPQCNGCGVCCQNEPCPLAAIFFHQMTGQCPALEDAGDRYKCGLIEHPAQYAPVRARIVGARRLALAAAHLIGVGVGCDAQAPGDPDDHAYSMRMRAGRAGDKHERTSAIAWVAWIGETVPLLIAQYKWARARKLEEARK